MSLNCSFCHILSKQIGLRSLTPQKHTRENFRKTKMALFLNYISAMKVTIVDVVVVEKACESSLRLGKLKNYLK